MGQNGSYWLYLSNGYCHTGQQFVIIIWVIYVIIMWVSHGIYGSYGSYMGQPWCIHKGHLGHIWTNHGSYMGHMGYMWVKNMSSPKWVICGSTMVAYHLGHIGYIWVDHRSYMGHEGSYMVLYGIMECRNNGLAE